MVEVLRKIKPQKHFSKSAVGRHWGAEGLAVRRDLPGSVGALREDVGVSLTPPSLPTCPQGPEHPGTGTYRRGRANTPKVSRQATRGRNSLFETAPLPRAGSQACTSGPTPASEGPALPAPHPQCRWLTTDSI